MNAKKLTKIEDEIEKLKQEDYSILEKQHGFMVDGMLGGFKAAIHKMHYTFLVQILLGILGGAILAFGYVACIVAVNAFPFGSGMGNIMLGLLFPGCIILITYLGGGLYTSHVVATIPMLKKSVSVSVYLKGIFGVLLGNWIGTLLFVIFFLMGGGLEMKIGGKSMMAQIYYMGLHKMFDAGDSILEGHALTFKVIIISVLAAFGSGVLCNFMVSSTLPLTNSSKHPVLAIMILFFPIIFFAMSGYQHSPANSFFMWSIFAMSIFKDAITHGDPVTLLGAGGEEATSQIINSISWSVGFLFLLINLLPSVVGNWVSGAIFLPGILYLINKNYADTFFNQERLHALQEILHPHTTSKKVKAVDTKVTSKTKTTIKK